MARNPRRIDAELDALYATLPKLDCQGRCYDSCGPISTSARERVRMEALAGCKLGVNGLTCSLLKDGRCSVYPVRPMICRLWGVVESLPCHYGCRPEGGLLPDEKGAELLVEAIRVGGPMTHADAELVGLIEAIKAEVGEENFASTLKEVFAATVPRPHR